MKERMMGKYKLCIRCICAVLKVLRMILLCVHNFSVLIINPIDVSICALLQNNVVVIGHSIFTLD